MIAHVKSLPHAISPFFSGDDWEYVTYFLGPFKSCAATLSAQKLDAFPQQQNFALGSLAQISSGAIRCSFNARFRTRLGSGANTS